MANPAFGSATFMSANAGAAYLMVEVLERPATEYGLWFTPRPGRLHARQLPVGAGERAALGDLP